MTNKNLLPVEGPTGPRSTLLALLVSRDGEPTCTLYEPGTVVPDRSSTWIRAQGDAFVDLAACR